MANQLDVERIRQAMHSLAYKQEPITYRNVAQILNTSGKYPDGVSSGWVAAALSAGQPYLLEWIKGYETVVVDPDKSETVKQRATKKLTAMKHSYVHDWSKGTKVTTAITDAEVNANAQHDRGMISREMRLLNDNAYAIQTSGSSAYREGRHVGLFGSVNQMIAAYNMAHKNETPLSIKPIANEFGKVERYELV